MAVAMGLLAVRRDRRRTAADPAGHRRHPPLPRAVVRRLEVLRRARAVGRADDRSACSPAPCSAISGIALAYHLCVRKPDAPGALRARLSGLHRIFVNKWYFDEVINFLVMRPFAWFGRFGRNTFERVVISGVFIGGTTAVVRAARPRCARRSRASCATTRRCCCSGSPPSASTSSWRGRDDGPADHPPLRPAVLAAGDGPDRRRSGRAAGRPGSRSSAPSCRSPTA